MWFFSFATEYELSKFERVVAEAWKDNLQVCSGFVLEIEKDGMHGNYSAVVIGHWAVKFCLHLHVRTNLFMRNRINLISWDFEICIDEKPLQH
jgi:hypothetical protein